MKTKIGKGDPVRAFSVHAISANGSVLPVVLSAALAKLEYLIGLCFRAESSFKFFCNPILFTFV
jgi:hypothetical protein